jgi:hypothetical protein
MVTDMCNQILPELVAAVAASADPAGLIAAVGTTKPMPTWATGLKDMRSALVWDSSQSICHIALDDVLTLGIVDTGASKSIISEGMAKQLGLAYEPAKEGNCGSFAVPGTAATNQYLGVVKDRLIVTFGDKAKFALTGLKIIAHPCNLFLVGADLLCGGRPSGMWNFNGIHSSTEGATCRKVSIGQCANPCVRSQPIPFVSRDWPSCIRRAVPSALLMKRGPICPRKRISTGLSRAGASGKKG